MKINIDTNNLQDTIAKYGLAVSINKPIYTKIEKKIRKISSPDPDYPLLINAVFTEITLEITQLIDITNKNDIKKISIGELEIMKLDSLIEWQGWYAHYVFSETDEKIYNPILLTIKYQNDLFPNNNLVEIEYTDKIKDRDEKINQLIN